LKSDYVDMDSNNLKFSKSPVNEKEKLLDRAIWVTWYDLPVVGRDHYLAWLHDLHIPRMLRKPGFLWAAHYVSTNNFVRNPRLIYSTDSTIPAGNEYILIFGAQDAHVLANPVPSKLCASISEDDREMLSRRSGERTQVFTEVARVDGPQVGSRENERVLSPCIQIGCYNATTSEGEEGILDWYANCRFPAIKTLPGSVGARRYVSVLGWGKHCVLYEFVSLEMRNEYYHSHVNSNAQMKDWGQRMLSKLIHLPKTPNVACRIWPAISR